jgi:hypothetical protein
MGNQCISLHYIQGCKCKASHMNNIKAGWTRVVNLIVGCLEAQKRIIFKHEFKLINVIALRRIKHDLLCVCTTASLHGFM